MTDNVNKSSIDLTDNVNRLRDDIASSKQESDMIVLNMQQAKEHLKYIKAQITEECTLNFIQEFQKSKTLAGAADSQTEASKQQQPEQQQKKQQQQKQQQQKQQQQKQQQKQQQQAEAAEKQQQQQKQKREQKQSSSLKAA